MSSTHVKITLTPVKSVTKVKYTLFFFSRITYIPLFDCASSPLLQAFDSTRRDVSTQTLYEQEICQAVDNQIRPGRRLCHLRRKHIHSGAQCQSLRLSSFTDMSEEANA
jgi:hypothetical protein